MADFTYSTTDANKLAGLDAEANKAGKTSEQYLRDVLDSALDSYAKMNGVTDPATKEEAIVVMRQAIADKEAAIAARDRAIADKSSRAKPAFDPT